jgi:hypothetical protein
MLYSLSKQDDKSDGEYKCCSKLTVCLSRQGSQAKGKAKETPEEQTNDKTAKLSKIAQPVSSPSPASHQATTDTHSSSKIQLEDCPIEPSPVKPSYTAEDIEKVESYRSHPTLQRMQLEEIAEQGYSSIPDQ